MSDDKDETDDTPAHTPDAKKSSGAWKFKFNAPDAVCARRSCVHRRDEHLDGSELRCMLCDCERFVAGGITPEEQRADTDREMPAVREEKK